jgi:hypothetical protein
MNTLRLALPALLALAFARTSSAQSIDLFFTSLGTSVLSLDEATSQLSFVPDSTSGFDFQVRTSSIPGLAGDEGSIAGTFNLGPVHDGSIGSAKEQVAAVSGRGTLTISDGTPSVLTGTISWDAITILETGGFLDGLGTPSLSDLSYHGTNPALLLLSAQNIGYAKVAFQFDPPTTLAELETEDGVYAAPYVGSFVAIPESRYTTVLVGGAVLAFVLARRRLRLG